MKEVAVVADEDDVAVAVTKKTISSSLQDFPSPQGQPKGRQRNIQYNHTPSSSPTGTGLPLALMIDMVDLGLCGTERAQHHPIASNLSPVGRCAPSRMDTNNQSRMLPPAVVVLVGKKE